MIQRPWPYVAARLGFFAAALCCVVLGFPHAVESLSRDGVFAFTLAFVGYVVLLRLPISLHVAARRRTLPSPRVPFELPIIASVLVRDGGVLCAAMILTGTFCAFAFAHRQRIVSRMLSAGTEASFWLAVSLLHPAISSAPSFAALAWFTLLFACVAYLYLMFVWSPLVALRERLPVSRLWRRAGIDIRLWSTYVLGGAWGYFIVLLGLREGAFFTIAAGVPLIALSSTVRILQKNIQELHRLRLARDAVQALLGARDPVPQMNQLLSSIYRSDAHETLQIFAATGSSRERLLPLASIGPELDAEQLELTRQVLIEVQHTERPSVTYRTRDYVVVAHPVRSTQDQLLGALLAHRSARVGSVVPARSFAQTAKELAPLLSDLQSIALTQTAATIDGLTGLANRRTIMQYLVDEIDEVRVGTPCAVLVMDIDRFKSINDTLGHQAGDHCLRVVGGIIARNIRIQDRAGRIGGEEFVVLMPETTREMAFTVAERLRTAVAASDLRYANNEPLTASIGVTVADIGDSVDSLLARADRALYQAKRQGRNRVIEIGA